MCCSFTFDEGQTRHPSRRLVHSKADAPSLLFQQAQTRVLFGTTPVSVNGAKFDSSLLVFHIENLQN